MSHAAVVPEVLWTPTPDRVEWAAITDFSAFVSARTGLDLPDYPALWEFSTNDLAGFWSAVADYFQVRWHDRPTEVLPAAVMPGADWFPGGTLNYAEQALTSRDGATPADPAVIAAAEDGSEESLTLTELRALVGAAQAGLRRADQGAQLRQGQRFFGAVLGGRDHRRIRRRRAVPRCEGLLGVVQRSAREPIGPRHDGRRQHLPRPVVPADLEVVGDSRPEAGQVIGRELPERGVVGEIQSGARADEGREIGDGGPFDTLRGRRPEHLGNDGGVAHVMFLHL